MQLDGPHSWDRRKELREEVHEQEDQQEEAEEQEERADDEDDHRDHWEREEGQKPEELARARSSEQLRCGLPRTADEA